MTRISLNSDLSFDVIMALNEEEKHVIEQCHLLFYGNSQRENVCLNFSDCFCKK